MSAAGEKVAPLCGHRFTVIYLRGNPEERLQVVRDLRLTYDGEGFVSDPYEIEPGQPAVAVCPLCKTP
jgi:hypothetical protein